MSLHCAFAGHIHDNRSPPAVLPYLRQDCFAELPNQGKSPVQRRWRRGFRKSLTALVTAYPSPMAESLLMLARFSSMEEWTYRSRVTLTLECPNISLRDFTSKPTSIQRVANV